jgi:hypothetical protein
MIPVYASNAPGSRNLLLDRTPYFIEEKHIWTPYFQQMNQDEWQSI